MFLKKVVGLDCISEHHFLGSGLRSDSIILDIGANKGQFYYQTREKYSGQFFLIEPNGELFRELKVVGTDRKFNVAITRETKQYTFYNSVNNEAGSLDKNMAAQWKLAEAETVDGWTFNHLMTQAGVDMIDVLKVDIEGAEIDLFNSLSNEQLRKIKQITCEFHDFMDQGQLQAVKDTLVRLKRNDFAILNFSFLDHRDVLAVNLRESTFWISLLLKVYCIALDFRRKIESTRHGKSI